MKNASCNPKGTAKSIGKRHFITTIQFVNLLILTCTTGTSCKKIRCKAKAPEFKNAFGKAVLASTDKQGFIMPKFLVCGVGHVHPLRIRTHGVVFKSRQGAPTMYPVKTSKGDIRPTHQAVQAYIQDHFMSATTAATWYIKNGNSLARLKVVQLLKALQAVEMHHA